MMQHAAGKKDYGDTPVSNHKHLLHPTSTPVSIYCFLFVYSIYITFTHTQEYLLKHTIFVLFHAL